MTRSRSHDDLQNSRTELSLLVGMQDVRVVAAESQQMVSALKSRNVPVTYISFRDEGHGFVRPENRLDFTARMEKFLADNLGGRYEPMKGDKIPGSTAKLRVVGASP